VYCLFAEVEYPQPSVEVLQWHECPVPGVGFRTAPGFEHEVMYVAQGKYDGHPVAMGAPLFDAGGVIYPHLAGSWHPNAVPLGDWLKASEEATFNGAGRTKIKWCSNS
jgi:hypothetical protein